METIQVDELTPRSYVMPYRVRSNTIDHAHEAFATSTILKERMVQPQRPFVSIDAESAMRFVEAPLLADENATAAKTRAIKWIARDYEAWSSRLIGTSWFIECVSDRAISLRRKHLAASFTPEISAPRENLASIQSAFGFQMQTLAHVLRISRPCLYKWLDPEQNIQIQASNRARLELVRQLAESWVSRSKVPLSSLGSELLVGGHTVIELLSVETIDPAAVNRAYDELTAKLRSRPKTLDQRLSEAGFKRRSTYRSLPNDE